MKSMGVYISAEYLREVSENSRVAHKEELVSKIKNAAENGKYWISVLKIDLLSHEREGLIRKGFNVTQHPEKESNLIIDWLTDEKKSELSK